MILVVGVGPHQGRCRGAILNSAPNVQAAIIGAVLNKVDMDYVVRYDPNRGSLYHNKDFSRYYLDDGNRRKAG